MSKNLVKKLCYEENVSQNFKIVVVFIIYICTSGYKYYSK